MTSVAPPTIFSCLSYDIESATKQKKIAMFTSSSKAQSANDAYHSIIASRQGAYNSALASGQFEPFVYPWDTFSAALLFFAILIIPRLPKRRRTLTSIGVFTWIVYLCLQTMLKARCLGLANGYGIGLMCALGMIMTVTLLFCNDLGNDLQRIEWRQVDNQIEDHPNGGVNGLATGAEGASTMDLEKRKVRGVDGPAVSVSTDMVEEPSKNPYHLVWQGYPTSILHCMEWSADLMITFRGVGWNWRVPTCPPLDLPIKDPKGKPKPYANAKTSSAASTSISSSTLRQIELTGLSDFIVQYLILDFLKTVMITDPYFMGSASLSSPSPWPFLASTTSTTIWLLTRFTRLTITITGVLSVLTFIFSLSPLFHITLLPKIVPPSYLTRSPLLEPALYPPYWGPLDTISTRGLAGLWGKWWHQLFRFGTSEPSRALIEYLNIDRKSQLARALQLGIAFGLSGFLHASASFTTFSPSKPLSGPFTFFVLQGVGIVLQQQLTNLCKKNLYSAYKLEWLCKAVNVGFVVVWMVLTGPFLADDFARCGVWLFEPVPVSFLRGVIWGEWWAWKSTSDWVGWYGGERWYRSGLAIY